MMMHTLHATESTPAQARRAMIRRAREDAKKWQATKTAELNAEYDAAVPKRGLWQATREYWRASNDLIRRSAEWNAAITDVDLKGGGEAELSELRERFTGERSEAATTERPPQRSAPAQVEPAPKTTAPRTVTPRSITPRPVGSAPAPVRPKRELPRSMPPTPVSRRRSRALTQKKSDDENRRPLEEPRVWENHPLEPDERIVMNVRRNAFWYVAPWVWILFMGGVDTISGALFFALGGVITWWWINQDRYLITDKRIIARVGVFNKDAIIIRLDRVQDVIVHRPFWVQLLRNGRVTIATAGGPTRELVIRNQDDPDKVANAIRGGPGR